VSELDADYFSQWYVAMETSDKDALWARLLDLPTDLKSTSLLTGPGLDEVAGLLDLGPGDVLLDLACGRGGYGLELARRSGCGLVGVDFAAPAIAQARSTASRMGLADRAEFVVADMTATGLGDTSVTAVLCVDAAQFPQPFGGPMVEAHRVLRPGGRAVFTGWQAADLDDPRLKPRQRSDYLTALDAAGFVDVAVQPRPDWRAAELDAWRRVLEVEPQGDPALLDLQEEARDVLAQATDLEVTRVLATGRRPNT
jgi:SAM-dependent methyltransferase